MPRQMSVAVLVVCSFAVAAEAQQGGSAIRGRVTGDAIALHGDVIIHPGGVVDGNAIAVDGRVRTIGGVVAGRHDAFDRAAEAGRR